MLYNLCGALQKLCHLSGNAFHSSAEVTFLGFLCWFGIHFDSLILCVMSCYSCILSGWSPWYRIIITDSGSHQAQKLLILEKLSEMCLCYWFCILVCCWCVLDLFCNPVNFWDILVFCTKLSLKVHCRMLHVLWFTKLRNSVVCQILVDFYKEKTKLYQVLSAASTDECGKHFTCMHLEKHKSETITKHVNFQSSRLLGKLKLDLGMINLELL